MTASIPIDVSGASHVGYVRQNNEDCYRDLPLGDGRSLAVVADGLGGHAAGEVASALAVEAVALWAASAAARELLDDQTELTADLVEAILDAHETVIKATSEEPARRGMGTTLTAAILGPDTVSFCHVGDSRLYHWQAGSLHQISEDMTVAMELFRAGKLSLIEASRHSGRNQLLQAVGLGEGRASLAPQSGCFDWQPGERLLLCSDGLTDMVADDAIAHELARAERAVDAVDALMQAALDAGAIDNVTLMVAAYLG